MQGIGLNIKSILLYDEVLGFSTIQMSTHHVEDMNFLLLTPSEMRFNFGLVYRNWIRVHSSLKSLASKVVLTLESRVTF